MAAPTDMPINALQTIVLNECADWADTHPCVKAIYIFGSVARGDYRPDSDVDIYVEVALEDNHEMVQDFTDLHGEADGFSITLAAKVRRDIHVHGMRAGVQTDAAWPTILTAYRSAVVVRGKASLVETPMKPALNIHTG